MPVPKEYRREENRQWKREGSWEREVYERNLKEQER
jgi:hypothetical protein